MTVQAAQLREDYTGTGGVSVYSYGWRIFKETELLVVMRPDGAEQEQELTLGTDYTVHGVGSKNGGSITLLAGNLPTGDRLVILPNIPTEQQTDFRNQGAFYPETHEDQFDRQTLMSKKNAGGINQSLRVPFSVRPNEFNTVLPANIKDMPRRAILVNEGGNGFDFTPKELSYDEWLAKSIGAADAAEAARNTTLVYRNETSDLRNESLQFRDMAQAAEANTLTYRNESMGFRDESEDFKNSARDSASLLSDVLDDALASGLNLPLDMGFTDQPVPPANMIDLGEA